MGAVYYPLGRGEEMSEGEYEYQYALCNDAGRDDEAASVPHKAPVGQWRVRSGAVLKISEMSVEHLKNAISYFERGGQGDNAKIKELREELAWR